MKSLKKVGVMRLRIRIRWRVSPGRDHALIGSVDSGPFRDNDEPFVLPMLESPWTIAAERVLHPSKPRPLLPVQFFVQTDAVPLASHTGPLPAKKYLILHLSNRREPVPATCTVGFP